MNPIVTEIEIGPEANCYDGDKREIIPGSPRFTFIIKGKNFEQGCRFRFYNPHILESLPDVEWYRVNPELINGSACVPCEDRAKWEMPYYAEVANPGTNYVRNNECYIKPSIQSQWPHVFGFEMSDNPQHEIYTCFNFGGHQLPDIDKLTIKFEAGRYSYDAEIRDVHTVPILGLSWTNRVGDGSIKFPWDAPWRFYAPQFYMCDTLFPIEQSAICHENYYLGPDKPIIEETTYEQYVSKPPCQRIRLTIYGKHFHPQTKVELLHKKAPGPFVKTQKRVLSNTKITNTTIIGTVDFCQMGFRNKTWDIKVINNNLFDTKSSVFTVR